MPRLLLLAFVLAFSAAAHAQLLVRDDAGRPLLVRKHFTRIVTLAPFLTEAAYAAGAGDLVVGVDALSDYPVEATRLPRVPAGAGFSLEAIARLKPDLVLAYQGGIRMEDVDAMTGFGATVYLAQARHLEDVPRLLQSIGALTGRDVRQAIADYQGRLDAIRRANLAKPKLAVFLEIWNRPLTTVGGDSLISEAMGVCRGENVFAGLGGIAPQVDWDEVQQVDPYVIVGVNSANNADEFHANWAGHRALRAVQANRLMYIESETLQRPTVRTLDSLARVCAELDQVRLHESLIAPSEAFGMNKGPVAASPAGGDVLQRPMTAAERDVAAVLASTYAVGKPAAVAAASPPADAAPSKAPEANAAAQRPAPAASPVPAEPPATAAPPAPSAPAAAQKSVTASEAVANEGLPPALRVAPSLALSASPPPRGAPAAPRSPGAYTQVSRAGDLYFVSGQIAVDPDTGRFDADAKVDAQTRAALENVRRVLEGERLTLANVVSTTVYLRDINDLEAMDRAYESSFRMRLPARSVIETRNLPRGARVEISVVAGR